MRKPNTLARVVHEVKLAAVAIHDLGDRWVAPQLVDGQGEWLGKAEVGIDGGEVQFVGCNLFCSYLWYCLMCQWVRAEGRGWFIRGSEDPQAGWIIRAW